MTEMRESTPNVEYTAEYFNSIMDKDNIMDQWIMINTPIPVLIVLTTYLLFILKIGPSFMANRQPYNATTLLRIYDIAQILYNMYFVFSYVYYYPGITGILIEKGCTQEGHEELEDLKRQALFYFWHFLNLKILDLLDTVFIVLRKKYSQISFLHVFHHSTLVLGSWYFFKYIKPIQAILPAMINICIHVIMYTYYFLATFPYLARLLSKWKKTLTRMQLTQFVVILLYITFLYYKGCRISKTFTYAAMALLLSFIVLFTNFYIKAYVKRSPNTNKKKT